MEKLLEAFILEGQITARLLETAVTSCSFERTLMGACWFACLLVITRLAATLGPELTWMQTVESNKDLTAGEEAGANSRLSEAIHHAWVSTTEIWKFLLS